jgi:cytochrome c biogenesis protein CcdA
MKGNFAAIVLVVVGALFLLTNLGVLNINLGEILRVWWPLILIIVGLSLFFTPRDKP